MAEIRIARHAFEGLRVTIRTDRPFDEVRAHLETHMGEATAGDLVSLARAMDTADEYDRAVTDRFVGPSGFISFSRIDHGGWIGLYGVDRRVVRWTLGNPLIAIEMIRRDVVAGLFVPVEILLIDGEDGAGCGIVYVLPSSLIAFDPGDVALREAALALDDKLERLLHEAAGAEGDR